MRLSEVSYKACRARATETGALMRKQFHGQQRSHTKSGPGRAKKVKPYHNATIERAHDVRKLRECNYCRGIGCADEMIIGEDKENGCFWNWHGRCFIEQFGLPKFLALPTVQSGKCRLDDIGIDHMRALMESSQWARKSRKR
jgi:hypothetical protein